MINTPTTETTMNQVNQYIIYMKDLNKATNTITSYVKDINAFLKYNEFPFTLTREQITQYKQYLLETRNNDAKSINRALSSLKSYNEFLVREKVQDSVVVLSIDYVKVQKQLTSPTNTTKNEAVKFMEKVKKNECPRNYYIVRLLLNTGLRISELLNIELDDINFKKENLKVLGKGSKQRIIPLNKTALEIIKLAIEDRKNYNHAITLDSQFLFLSNKSKTGKLESSSVERIFNKYSNTITCHSLRHVFATNFLEDGGNIRELQMILGHSSIATTTIYTHPTESSLRKNINSCSI